jgi:transcription termination factor Rho
MSGTRKEEKLLPRAFLDRVYLLRRALNRARALEAMELLVDRMEQTPDNETFLEQIGASSRRAEDDVFDHGM